MREPFNHTINIYKKIRENMQVIVDRLESTTDLHAHLSAETMAKLQLEEDDVIKIASPARKFIIAAVTSKDFQSPDNCICIGRTFRQLLECYLGETVMIEPFTHCQVATKVVLAPIADTMSHLQGNFLDIIHSSNYDFSNIPVWKDMVIPIYALQHVFEFRVIECSPIMAVIVTDTDVFECQSEPVQRTKSPIFDKPCYDDVGGISSQLLTIRKLVENPRTSSALIIAPSGCGKTFLATVIQNETKSHFEFIPSLQLLGMKFDKAKVFLGRLFDTISQSTPAIVYIDDLDAIAGIQMYEGDQEDNRLVNAFGDFIEKLRKIPNILILATSKSLDDLRHDYHPPTRFNETIYFHIPNRDERAEMLRAMTRKMTLASPNAIDDMASMTEGQTPSDLSLICQRTVFSHINYLLSNLDNIENPVIRLDDLKEVQVGQSNASRNHRKKNAKGQYSASQNPFSNSKKKSPRVNNLDLFGDLLSQQDGGSNDSDDDNSTEDENFMFSLGGNRGNSGTNSNQAFSNNPFGQNSNPSISPNSVQPQSPSQDRSNDDIFGFRTSSTANKSNDIFGQSTQQSRVNDPFSSSPSNARNSTVVSDPFSTYNANQSQVDKSHRHKKRGDGDDDKKHKKHKKHNKKKDEAPQQQSFGSSSNPFNSSQANPFNSFQQSSQPNDPFAQPKNPVVADPFSSSQSKPNDFADPFASGANSNGNNIDPFAQPRDGNRNADPFSSAAGNRPPDPFARASTSNQPSDPFSADPFSSKGNKNARKSIDPFAPPKK